MTDWASSPHSDAKPFTIRRSISSYLRAASSAYTPTTMLSSLSDSSGLWPHMVDITLLPSHSTSASLQPSAKFQSALPTSCFSR